MARKLVLLFLLLSLLLSISSCSVYRTLDVPGMNSFLDELKSKYPYVKNIKCIFKDPISFEVWCRLSKYVDPEIMADLIEALMEYSSTDVLCAYNEQISDEIGSISLLFHVKANTVYFGYNIDFRTYGEPVWELY